MKIFRGDIILACSTEMRPEDANAAKYLAATRQRMAQLGLRSLPPAPASPSSPAQDPPGSPAAPTNVRGAQPAGAVPIEDAGMSARNVVHREPHAASASPQTPGLALHHRQC